MTGDQLTQMLREVCEGVTVSPTDTPEEAAARTQIALEVQEIRDLGGIVDIPGEWP